MSGRGEYPFGLVVEAGGRGYAAPVVLASETDEGLDDEAMNTAHAAIAANEHVTIFARSVPGLVAAARQFQEAVREYAPRSIH